MEARLRRIAFGDTPGATLPSTAGIDPRCRWLVAVVRGARGEYAAAATALAALSRGPDPVVAALASATYAAHRRQLGGHAAARPLDAAALVLATAAMGRADGGRSDPDGMDAMGALADALLGLAADNLALGRPAAARRFLGRAGEIDAGWRAAVRTGWVTAELALSVGNAGAAVDAAERAERLVAARGETRHLTKSRIVLAASLAATGTATARARAARLVTRALADARATGLRSLSWPAGLLAADLVTDLVAEPEPSAAVRHRRDVTAELHALLLRSDPQGRRLAYESAWVPL